MYLNFFKMKKQPFNVTPDPEFLYLGSSHKEALAAVIYGIKQKKGFIAIVGEVGMGKTTIIRSYLDRVDRNLLTPIYLFNANISFPGLLKTLLRELGLDSALNDPFDMVTELHKYLINEYSKGRTVVLIIDEAQNMPLETLENLRMLSNLETAKDKLLQIVFSGQPEFDGLLARHELRQLKQRISVKATIMPLSSDESLGYIRHRLAKAADGEKQGSIFSDSAMRLIVRQANGIPRVINMLCDNCLITAYGQNCKTINIRIVKEIIADCRLKKVSVFRWGYAIVASLLVVFCVVGLYAAINPQHLPATRPVAPLAVSPVETTAVAPTVASPVETTAVAPAADKQISTVGDAASGGEAAEQPATVYRLVKKGDTMAKLMVDIYGNVGKTDFELVKKNNPGIKDVNRIAVGEKIIFPANR